MRRTIEFIAEVIGAALVCVAAWYLLVNPTAWLRSYPALSVFILVFGGVLVATVLHALILALAVLVMRGRQYVAFVSPKRCTTFGTWLVCDWHFFGKGGMQEGMRFFGLEMAILGQLS